MRPLQRPGFLVLLAVEKVPVISHMRPHYFFGKEFFFTSKDNPCLLFRVMKSFSPLQL